MSRTPARIVTAALALGVLTAPLHSLTAAAAVPTPSSFTSVSSQAGPRPGEVTISWAQDGRSTTDFVVETGLTSFSTTDASLPVHARGSSFFSVPASQRSMTLTAAQTAAAGAPVGSANHLYFRLHALNHTSAGDATKFYPYLQTVPVAPAVPAGTGTALRLGSFNVRTARATTDTRTWLERAPDVARSIVDHNPGVVTLQELGPGRADGQTGTLNGTPRQTDSLLTALGSVGGSRYRLTRTTPYVKAGTPSDTQGMRILYDGSRYTLVSNCVDTSPDGSYSDSCSIKLPIRSSGDTEDNRRRSAYAELADKQTGEHFFVVSVHLDARHSSTVATEQTYEALRGAQVTTTLDAVNALNPQHYPVVLGGDLNSWQNNKVGYTAHDRLVAARFYDTSAATQPVNIHFTTLNDFVTTMTDPSPGFGARLDFLGVQGITGARYWENVMKVTDSARPSDHNLILADVRLPAASSPSPSPTPTPSATPTPSPTPTPTPSPTASPSPVATTYKAVTPARLLDTRNGTGTTTTGPLPAGGSVEVSVAGRAGVPTTGVSAVVLNLTAVAPAQSGYLTVYPAGEARTSASTVNYRAGQTVTNNVIVKVGTGGKVVVYTPRAAQVLLDVQGYFPVGAAYTPLSPARVLDTRDGTGTTGGKLTAGTGVDLQVTGRGGVPASGVGAVVVNLTATQTEGSGYVTAYPTGQPRSSASSLNYAVNQSVANGVIVKVGTGGKVSLWSPTGTHLIADVQGWFPVQSDLTALAPVRLLDTRDGTGTSPGLVAAGGRVDLLVLGRGGVPTTGVAAVVLNVTNTKSAASGALTVFPMGTARPMPVNLNYAAAQSIANRVIVPVGTDGRVSLYTSATDHMIADVVGYLRQ